MSITASQIRELRETTGAGMMDCKRALERAEGDREKAAAVLRELGLVQEKKREDRQTNEGRVFVRTTPERSVILKLACETDFVARTDDFTRLGEACLDLAFSQDDPGQGIDDSISRTAARIRENIVLKSIRSLTAGPSEILYSYIHGEGRIGVTIRLSLPEPNLKDTPELSRLIPDLALHAAAFAPAFLSREEMDPAFLEAKRTEFTEDLKRLGKKDSMIEGIVRGKLEKLRSKVCFLEQAFIRDEKRTVNDALKEAADTLGATPRLTGFLYESVNAPTA